MKGFKSFANAAVTIAGVELAHRIHKHQFSLGRLPLDQLLAQAVTADIEQISEKQLILFE